MNFRQARLTSHAQLNSLVVADKIIPREAVSDELLSRIHDTFAQSIYGAIECFQVLEQQGFIEP